MAEGFKRPGSADFEPLKQTEIRSDFKPTESDPAENTPTQGQSRAEILVEEYDKTIAFAKWLEGILDDELKDVVVEIDPEEQPEVWMAMQRIFASPNPKISYQSYAQVLAALEEVDEVEATVDNPFETEDQFIEQFVQKISEDESALERETTEMEIETEDPAPTEDAATSTLDFPQKPKPAPSSIADRSRGNDGN